MKYLLDTHALFEWALKENISLEFCGFLDQKASLKEVAVSSISFWELAFLQKAKRIFLQDLEKWAQEIISFSGVILLDPSPFDMIASVALPSHHKDPFDRLLVAQAIKHHLTFITRDKLIKKYSVKTLWK